MKNGPGVWVPGFCWFSWQLDVGYTGSFSKTSTLASTTQEKQVIFPSVSRWRQVTKSEEMIHLHPHCYLKKKQNKTTKPTPNLFVDTANVMIHFNMAGCSWLEKPENICLHMGIFVPVVRRQAYIDQLFLSHTRQGGIGPHFPNNTWARHGGCPWDPVGMTCSLGSFSVHSLPSSYSAQLRSNNFSRESTV